MPGICRPSGTVQHTQYSSTDVTPTALFENFFDDEVMQLLADNTNKYALQKGKHGFVTSPMELRLFIAILINSGYAPLPHRRHWLPTAMVWNQSAQLSIGPVPRNVGLIYLSHMWSPSITSTWAESTAWIKTSPPTGYPFGPASGGGLCLLTCWT